MKITQEFDGETFTFRFDGQELRLTLRDFSHGRDIKQDALKWAKAIDARAEF
jgi:hypothetical protein